MKTKDNKETKTTNSGLGAVGGSTCLSENEIEEQIAMEEHEDSLWNDVDDDLDGLPYHEVDETLFAIESNFPPSNLTEEQWNRERS